MNRLLLAFAFLACLANPVLAQLVGTDIKPGDPCMATQEGHVARNASADRNADEITLMCDGTTWQSATGGGGFAVLQGQDDPDPCTPEKDGLIKYNASANPRWEYCHGGTTSWLPFRLPQCQDNDTGECTLAALRGTNDPQFTAANIRCGSQLLGVTGTYGSGSSNAFAFADATNVALSTLTTAAAVTVSGIPASCPGDVSVAGQGSPQISINGGAWTTSGNIANGQTLAVRLTSSASFNTAHTAVVSVGGTDDIWSVTTLPADTTPNAFSFTDQTGVALSTLATSNSITIGGINTTAPVSVTGATAQISINGGAWGTSGTITNGQTLAVRLTSDASPGVERTAMVSVGGVTSEWSVTTVGPDTTPAAFTFADVTGANLSTLTTATAITISGINTSTPVSVSGAGSPQLSINGGTWVTSGNIINGQTLAVRLTSSASFSTPLSATINVGGVTDSWSVTTLAADTTPNAFSFTDATGAALNTVITSNTIAIAGINSGASVSVSGTGSPQISINGGAWATSGTITNGQNLQVRLTSANANMTDRSATVNVGGVTTTWSVTTLGVNRTYNLNSLTSCINGYCTANTATHGLDTAKALAICVNQKSCQGYVSATTSTSPSGTKHCSWNGSSCYTNACSSCANRRFLTLTCSGCP